MAKQFETKNGQGAMFEVDDKKGNDKYPDFTGNIITPSGDHLCIAGWKKKSQAGKKYLSLSVEVKKPQTEPKSEKGGW
jgi:hypothetical protein